ncbi:unnamed protein product, partial [Effrenium voratum]
MGAVPSQGCCHVNAVVCDLDPKSASLLYLDMEDEGPDARSSPRLRGVPVLRVHSTQPFLKASGLDRSAVEEFREMLQSHGVSTGSWGKGGAKSVEHLFWEVFYSQGSLLTGLGAKLKRVARLLTVRILADIEGKDHVLVSRLRVLYNCQHQGLRMPQRKLRWKMPEDNVLLQSCEEVLSCEDCATVDSWHWAALEELGLPALQACMKEETSAYTYFTEDNLPSESYPGLNTLVCVHQVTLRVTDPGQAKVATIGLPFGQEFATADAEFDLERFHCKDQMLIGSQLNVWTWVPASDIQANTLRATIPAPAESESPAMKRLENELMLHRRVPVPVVNCLTKAAAKDGAARAVAVQGKKGAPNPHLRRILQSKRTDWTTVRKMARSLLDPNYSLSEFYEDLTAFPELFLYLRDGVLETGSGRTTDDEYQRTVCAFFAIYWLMRLDIDGRQGFSFGTDDDWKALQESAVKDGEVAMQSESGPTELQKRLFQLDRRLAFFNSAQ